MAGAGRSLCGGRGRTGRRGRSAGPQPPSSTRSRTSPRAFIRSRPNRWYGVGRSAGSSRGRAVTRYRLWRPSRGLSARPLPRRARRCPETPGRPMSNTAAGPLLPLRQRVGISRRAGPARAPRSRSGGVLPVRGRGRVLRPGSTYPIAAGAGERRLEDPRHAVGPRRGRARNAQARHAGAGVRADRCRSRPPPAFVPGKGRCSTGVDPTRGRLPAGGPRRRPGPPRPRVRARPGGTPAPRPGRRRTRPRSPPRSPPCGHVVRENPESRAGALPRAGGAGVRGSGRGVPAFGVARPGSALPGRGPRRPRGAPGDGPYRRPVRRGGFGLVAPGSRVTCVLSCQPYPNSSLLELLADRREKGVLGTRVTIE
ncbi:hypothetical protein SUDANB121_03260 [Nocardiopsis dassonvillei]